MIHAVRRLLTPAPAAAASIRQALATPLWLVKQAMASAKYTPEVSDDTIHHMIEVLGLPKEPADLVRFQQLKQALERQMKFIARLYHSQQESLSSCGNNDSVFRLLAADFKAAPPLTLESLTKQIEALEPLAARGEHGFDISQIGDHRTNFVLHTKP